MPLSTCSQKSPMLYLDSEGSWRVSNTLGRLGLLSTEHSLPFSLSPQSKLMWSSIILQKCSTKFAIILHLLNSLLLWYCIFLRGNFIHRFFTLWWLTLLWASNICGNEYMAFLPLALPVPCFTCLLQRNLRLQGKEGNRLGLIGCLRYIVHITNLIIPQRSNNYSHNPSAPQ